MRYIVLHTNKPKLKKLWLLRPGCLDVTICDRQANWVIGGKYKVKHESLFVIREVSYPSHPFGLLTNLPPQLLRAFSSLK